ncbi:MAG: anti-sigma factor antagonist [Micromonosporaceae bacterium]|nr:anti-sigma factor antagonist [Micromonosporaceae bacterium]
MVMARTYEIVRNPTNDGVRGIHVAGDVDLSSHDELLQTILDTIEPGVTELVIDLSDVTFFDSGALGVLVAGHNAARRADCAYRIVNPPDLVRRVLRTTGILDLLAGGPAPAAKRQPA